MEVRSGLDPPLRIRQLEIEPGRRLYPNDYR